MHNRIKVKEKFEIELEKKKKYQEKAARFKKGQDVCLKSKANNDYNKEVMRNNWDLVAMNPDVYSLWNMRKEYIMIMKDKYCKKIDEFKKLKQNQLISDANNQILDQQKNVNEKKKSDSANDLKKLDEHIKESNVMIENEIQDRPIEMLNEESLTNEFQKLCNDELELTEYALLKNSKSYSAWQHRLWILNLIPRPNFDREFQLNEAYLQKDGRNLHCWHYRINLCDISGRSIEDEIKFSLDRIKDNLGAFSYSTLYYRSLILTKASNLGLINFSKYWCDEYKLVENALFTEPNDQALWFYLRWLLLTDFGRCLNLSEQSNDARLIRIVFNKECRLLIFYFDKVIKKFPFENISLENSNFFNQSDIQTVKHYPSKLWFIHLKNVHDINEIQLDSEKFDFDVSDNYRLWVNKKLNQISSNSQMKIHKEQLDSLLTLKQLEPDNKWLNLILSYFENTDQLQILDDLINLDPLRINYYNDQKSKIKLENLVLKPDQNNLDLSNLQLTALYSIESFSHLTILDLTGNRLRCLVTNLNSLISLKKFIVDENYINEIHQNFTLPNLQSLSLRNNHLDKNSGINYLVFCPNLERIDFSGNQISDDDIKELISKNINCVF